MLPRHNLNEAAGCKREAFLRLAAALRLLAEVVCGRWPADDYVLAHIGQLVAEARDWMARRRHLDAA